MDTLTHPMLTINPSTGKLLVKFSESPVVRDIISTSGEIDGIQVGLDSGNHVCFVSFGQQIIVLENHAIRYSPQRDLLYVRLYKGKHDCSIEIDSLDDDVIFDFDTENRVLGLAIINAKKYFPQELLQKITQDWMGIQCVNIPEKFFIDVIAQESQIPSEISSATTSTNESYDQVENDEMSNESDKKTDKKKRKARRKKKMKIRSNFLNSVCQGSLDRARQYFEEDNSVIHDVDNQGGNAVILAASYGAIDVLEWINKDLRGKEFPRKISEIPGNKNPTNSITIKAKYDDDEDNDDEDNEEAPNSEIRKAEFMKTINGHDPSSCVVVLNEFRRIDGSTAFLQAAAHGKLEVLKWLLKNDEIHVNMNESNYCGDTALHHAAAGGHLSVLQWLLDNGAKIDARTKSGSIALHRAATAGHLDAVKLLISCGSNVDDKTLRGATALHYAARNNHVPVVQWLLEFGGASITHTDNDGISLLDIIKSLGNPDLTTWIENYCKTAQTKEHQEPSTL